MNRKPTAKSAPSYGRKRNEKKMSSLREIEMWVNQDNKEISSRTSARNVGLLAENVTEDILLYARQCELGRERYKFLVNHAYERQKFLENQNKKEKSMKKQMLAARRSIDKTRLPFEPRRRLLTVRIPQVDQTDSPTDGLDEVDGGPDEVFLSPGRANVATAKEINIVLHSGAEKEIHLPKAVTLDTKKNKGTYLKTGSVKSDQQVITRAKDKLPSVMSAVCKEVSYGGRPESLKSIKSGKTSVTRASNTPSGSKQAGKEAKAVENSGDILVATKIADVPNEPINSWASKSPYARMRKFGQRFSSSVDDPRYVALASSLIPHSADGSPRSDIKDIIARKDALSKRSNCEGDYRKRLHARYIAQILQRELSATM